jgi:hypothetical protein
MSTEIKSCTVGTPLTLNREPNTIGIMIAGSGRDPRSGSFDVDEFLAAVDAECDAVIIRRRALPAVTPERRGYSGYVGVDGYGSGNPEQDPIALLGSPEDHLLIARRHIAIAGYMQSRRNVDEAQVEALKLVIWGLPISLDAGELARTLIATGKVQVTA